MNERAVEAALAARRLPCPDCAGPLSAWGFAREREVRMLHGVRSCRPRRTLCGRCDATHVLCPAWSVPRRRDGAQVIGEALRQAAGGDGHRTRPARPVDQNARTRQARTPDRTRTSRCGARATMMSSDRSRDQTPRRPPPAGPARPSRKLPDEHALLQELWQISHFGWIAHETMLRSLTISAGHQIADAALAGQLQQLLDRGWMEQRSSAAHAGQREWRLTDSGRNAVRKD